MSRIVGLGLMEGRIRLLGGALSINSEANLGTRVSFTVPINGDKTV